MLDESSPDASSLRTSRLDARSPTRADDARTDAVLVAALVARSDDGAFDQLVERHYAMVFGTCLRVTGDHHDAEDAAQSVFLTLAVKAGSLAGVDSLAGWLHGVARNVALRVRETQATRRRHEQGAGVAHGKPVAIDPLAERLEEALARVPESYRIPLLLHYREGQCCRSIAAQIGVREETVAMRLSRGRQLLRRHLVRSGSLAGLSLLVAEANASAPAGLSGAGAAIIHGGSPVGVPARAVALMRSTVDGLALVAGKSVAILVTAVLVVTGTIAAVAVAARSSQPLVQSVDATARSAPTERSAPMARDLSSTTTLPGTETHHLLGATTAPYPYIEYLPGGYQDQPQRLWPLVVQLHNIRLDAPPFGETAADLDSCVPDTILARTREGRHFPAVILLPASLASGDNNWLPWKTSALIHHALTTYRIDPHRIYVCGAYSGGVGSYDAVLGSTGLIAAIVPVCGMAKLWPAEQYRALLGTSIWAHTSQDDGFSLRTAAVTFDALGGILGSSNRIGDGKTSADRGRTARWSATGRWEWTDGIGAVANSEGHQFHYTINPPGQDWTQTWRNDAVWDWLFRQVRPENGSPGFASTPPLTATVDVPYSYAIAATGSPPPTLSLSGAPSWLSLQGNVLSGTPRVAGPSNPHAPGHTAMMVLKASNGIAPDAGRVFRIDVVDTPR
ncbi:MAG: sigma-70 family RNA polymerase sigma factor [Planctomycetes bacterium]|nr:sigma-70 family RNA polymerase sigma factor [Planctomycetota bacterium]